MAARDALNRYYSRLANELSRESRPRLPKKAPRRPTENNVSESTLCDVQAFLGPEVIDRGKR